MGMKSKIHRRRDLYGLQLLGDGNKDEEGEGTVKPRRQRHSHTITVSLSSAGE